jgi:hypothetical protein
MNSASGNPKVKWGAAIVRWLFVGLCVVAVGGLLCSTLGRGSGPALRLLYSIPVPGEYVAVLEDVSRQGVAILNATGGDYLTRTEPSPDFQHPKLLLWNVPEQKMLREIPLDDCVKRRAQVPERLRTWRLGPFRFVQDGAKVMGLQTPWLFLVDALTGREVSRYLLSPGLLKGVSPYAGIALEPLEAAPNGDLVAAVANQGSIANQGAVRRLVVLRADLQGVIADAPLEYYVADRGLAWSPDGGRIAVLYDLFLDEKGHDVDWWGKDSLFRTQRDVEVFDARSGRSLLRFKTGAWEDGISFSRDGEALWCVSANRSDLSGWSKDVIRIFSSSDGRLMRTVEAGGWGLRGNFVISPSGRLVVADASKIVPYFLKEPNMGQKIGRFVLLDAQTGEALFRYHRRTAGYYIWPSHFAFTSDERYLLVDPNNFHGGPDPRLEEHVDVYMVR